MQREEHVDLGELAAKCEEMERLVTLALAEDQESAGRSISDEKPERWIRRALSYFARRF